MFLMYNDTTVDLLENPMSDSFYTVLHLKLEINSVYVCVCVFPRSRTRIERELIWA
jgi:hypothetical protein